MNALKVSQKLPNSSKPSFQMLNDSPELSQIRSKMLQKHSKTLLIAPELSQMIKNYTNTTLIARFHYPLQKRCVAIFMSDRPFVSTESESNRNDFCSVLAVERSPMKSGTVWHITEWILVETLIVMVRFVLS